MTTEQRIKEHIEKHGLEESRRLRPKPGESEDTAVYLYCLKDEEPEVSE